MNEPLPKDDDFQTLKAGLQKFQQHRLRHTYDDIIDDAQYGPMADFFFTRLYASEDLSLRNSSIRKLHRKMQGQISEKISTAVSEVIDLHELSDSLDDRMALAMQAMGIGSDLDETQYGRVYRSLDNYDERLLHLSLVVETIRSFHRLSRSWTIGLSIKAAGKAARIMGLGAVMEFIQEGFESFRAIRDIEFLIGVIQEREQAWHDYFWQETPDGCMETDGKFLHQTPPV